MTDSTKDLQTQLREAERRGSAAERALKDMKSRRVTLMGWSAVAGFMLFAVGGQWFPGYQLDSTAEAAAAERANGAVSNVMAELCAERFMRTAGFESRLSGLDAASGDWSKAKYIREGAWAATPDGERSDHSTAEKCRVLITNRVADQSEKSS